MYQKYIFKLFIFLFIQLICCLAVRVPNSESKRTIDSNSEQKSLKDIALRGNVTIDHKQSESSKSIKQLAKQNSDSKMKDQSKTHSPESNFGIRVIKAPSLEHLRQDGQRLMEMKGRITASKLKKSTGSKEKAIRSSSTKQTKKSPSNSVTNEKSSVNLVEMNEEVSLDDKLTANSIKNQPYKSKQYMDYKYDHHINHINNLNSNVDRDVSKSGNFEVRSNTNQFHDLLNDRIQKTKDQMKINIIQHQRLNSPSNRDQINMEPLKVHLNPYLRGKHHRPNILWGNPKFPPNQLSKASRIVYNRKQGPDPFLVKKQLEYRRNPYPHLRRFKHLVKLNNVAKQGSKFDEYNGYQIDHDEKEGHKDFGAEFDKEERGFSKFSNFQKSTHPIYSISNLDQLSSIDFRTLAPVYVKNIDYDTFYKLNPYFTLPLPQYN